MCKKLNNRLTMIKLKAVPILQVYMPTTKTSEDEVEKIYLKIEELINLTNGEENRIITGDWNAIVGEDADGKDVGKYRLGTRNKRGDRLNEFCRYHDLFITNTLFKSHKRRGYTYKISGDIN